MARILSRLRQARHRFSVANLFHHEPIEQQQPEPKPQTSEMGAQKDKAQYDEFAEAYHKSTSEIPHSLLESDLIRTALGDCKDCRILDLAGGSGNHARIAIEAGAAENDAQIKWKIAGLGPRRVPGDPGPPVVPADRSKDG